MGSMGIGKILFNVNGRISKRQFWQGIVVLVTIQIFYTVLDGYIPSVPRFALGIFMFIALIWAYVGTYGKRFHDAGLTAWWYVACFIGYLVISSVTGNMFAEAFGGDPAQLQEDLEAQAEAMDLMGMLGVIDAYNREMMIPNILQLVFLNVIIGLVPGLLIGSDPFENVHGDPVGGAAFEDDFE